MKTALDQGFVSKEVRVRPEDGLRLPRYLLNPEYRIPLQSTFSAPHVFLALASYVQAMPEACPTLWPAPSPYWSDLLSFNFHSSADPRETFEASLSLAIWLPRNFYGYKTFQVLHHCPSHQFQSNDALVFMFGFGLILGFIECL